MSKKLTTLLFAIVLGFGFVKTWRVYSQQIKMLYKGDSEYIERYVEDYPVAKWLNSNLEIGERAAIWGPQIFWFLNHMPLHLHPLNNDFELVSYSNSLELFEYLCVNNVRFVVLGKYRKNEIHRKSERPNLALFFYKMNSFVDDLVHKRLIILKSETNTSDIFEIKCERHYKR